MLRLLTRLSPKEIAKKNGPSRVTLPSEVQTRFYCTQSYYYWGAWLRPPSCAAAKLLQTNEPGRIRRIHAREHDCELEVRNIVACIASVRVEDEVGIDSITGVGHLPRSGEPALGEIFADEIESLIAGHWHIGINVLHVDFIL